MNIRFSIPISKSGRILISVLFLSGLTSTVAAQGTGPGSPRPNPGVTIQLPSIGVFGVNTVVSVPDGGTTSLGGVSRYSAGRTSRGVPGLAGIPYLNRPFRNQGIGFGSSARRALVNVRIISLDEMESSVLREAGRRAAFRQSNNPNGSVSTQKKADFLSRNMGRSFKKRR